VTLTLGSGETQFFRFSLRDPNGRAFQNLRSPGENVSIVTFGSGKATIAPGADYRQEILVSQWFTFESAGSYILTTELMSPAEIPNGAILAVPGGTAWLEVRPRDAAQLNKTCAALADRVIGSLSVEKWQFPARALASIEDPVAVPYLARALTTNKGTENIIVPALERIGDDQAVEVLLSALTNHSGEVAELARQSLMRLRTRIADPKLKQAVRQALAKT
jgi:PBS lyase HEAT-like repeat